MDSWRAATCIAATTGSFSLLSKSYTFSGTPSSCAVEGGDLTAALLAAKLNTYFKDCSAANPTTVAAFGTESCPPTSLLQLQGTGITGCDGKTVAVVRGPILS